MHMFLYLFLLGITFSFPLKASDRPKEMMEKAERDFAKQDVVEYPYLTKALRELSRNNESILVCQNGKKQPSPLRVSKPSNAQEMMAKLTSGLPCTVMTTQEFRAQREERNDRLLHALNAGISLISDYILQFQEDRDLTWTFETWPLYRNKELVPLIGGTLFREEKSDKASFFVYNSHFYEIMRQKSCVELSTLLCLMRFWKKTIFRDNTTRSYSNTDAVALRSQVMEKVNSYKETIDYLYKIDEWKLNLNKSILLICEDLLAAVPNEEMIFISSNESLQERGAKAREREKLVQSKTEKYSKYYVELYESSTNLTCELKSLIQNPINRFFKRNYMRDFQKVYQTYLASLDLPGSEKMKKDILDLDKLFQTRNEKADVRFEKEPEEKKHEAGSVESVIGEPAIDHFSGFVQLVFSNLENYHDVFVTLFSGLDNRSLTCLASTNNILSQTLSGFLCRRLQDHYLQVYSPDYWRAENSLHQQRKQMIVTNEVAVQEVRLTDYEITLFSFLQANIFRVNRHLKVSKLKTDLGVLYFDVVVNKEGKGSLHYVKAADNNPLFGLNSQLEGAFFDVHLPHENAVIPPAYFRYIKSGFQNIFKLNRDYIESHLKANQGNSKG